MPRHSLNSAAKGSNTIAKDETWRLNCGTTPIVSGWTDRFDSCPLIEEYVHFARSDEAFEVFYRGQSEQPEYLNDIFLVGQKAKATVYAGNVERLEFDPRNASENRNLFKKVLVAYLSTDMAKKFCNANQNEVLQRFDDAQSFERFDLTQLLLAALHYQNCREELAFFRTRMFLLSATLCDRIALTYALTPGPRTKGKLYDKSFIFEYAPPKDADHFEMVESIASRFQRAGLGDMFHNRDQEAFIKFAMLPHYLLGYGHLRRVVSDLVEYRCEYTPNPHYLKAESSLSTPPELNELQEVRFGASKHRMAWVQLFEDEGWARLLYRQKKADVERDISRPHN